MSQHPVSSMFPSPAFATARSFSLTLVATVFALTVSSGAVYAYRSRGLWLWMLPQRLRLLQFHFQGLLLRRRALSDRVHQPLSAGQIRLLRLPPGGHHDDLRLELVAVPLESPPAYHAVSYSWGRSTQRVRVPCRADGDEDTAASEGDVLVTPNILQGLRRWRDPKEPVLLWIDSLCINQDDTAEKSQQIRLMRRIYAQAERVVVWLGDATDGSNSSNGDVDGDGVDSSGIEGLEKLVADALAALPEVSDNPLETAAAGERLQAEHDALSAQGIEPPTKQLDWAPLRRLLTDYDWFERTWVFQEATANARTVVQCGDVRTPLMPLADVALRMCCFALYGDHVFDNQLNTATVRFFHLSTLALPALYGQDRITLIDCIRVTSGLKVTDLRDRVLGIMSLCTTAESFDRFHVGDMYRLPLADFYTQFARYELEEKHDLTILALAPHLSVSDLRLPRWLRWLGAWRLSSGTARSLPSWVPDLEQQHFDAIPMYHARHSRYSAGGDPGSAGARKLRIVGGGKVLQAEGAFVGHIANVASCFLELPLPPRPAEGELPAHMDDYADDHVRALLDTRGWEQEMMELATGCYTSEGENDLAAMDEQGLWAPLWRVLTCERMHLNDRAHPESQQGLIDALRRFIVNKRLFLETEDEGAARAAKEAVSSAQPRVGSSTDAWASPRRLATITMSAAGAGGDGGRRPLALVPRQARRGDKICVLLGSQVPFVLRPVSSWRGWARRLLGIGGGEGEPDKEGVQYTLVGECYVDGIMDGELLRDNQLQTSTVTIV